MTPSTNRAAGSPIASLVHRLLPRLRYPYLFLLLCGLLVTDLLLPDPIPLLDEATLALLTFLVGSWRGRRDQPPPPPPIDVTPRPGEPPAP